MATKRIDAAGPAFFYGGAPNGLALSGLIR
jgi:hypothetical protein